MTAALYLVIYGSVAVFVVASIVRALRYAKMPMHLRWELYPIPGAVTARWRYMAVEILLLRGLWEFNRPLWFRSFPFHFGLYLVAGSIVLTFASATVGLPPAPLTRVIGAAGVVLALGGAVALLARRLTDAKLRIYTTSGDIANLALFIVTFAILGIGYLTADASFPGAVLLASGLLRFDTAVSVPPLLAVGLMLGALLAAYIPLTHMSHFIGKYFTYHAVRWDDREARSLAQQVARNLAYRPRWAASHMHADGARSWAEVATINPAERTER